MEWLPRIVVACFLPVLAAQQPSAGGATKPRPADVPRGQGVQYDNGSGWPIGADETPAAPAGEVAAPPRPPAGERGRSQPPARADAAAPARSEAPAVPQLASGTQLGSPLLDVYAATQPPGTWRQLGGVVVWWRITIHGSQGEVIGMRELTHTADTAFLERDRLEHADGRIYGRLGAQVYAERSGMPMPTLADDAAQQLHLFGLQLRLPWLFGDAKLFAVTGKDVEERGGDRLRKVLLEQRPPASEDLLGPEAQPRPRDRYELLYEPSAGEPREFVHRFAVSGQKRRVLLEDWRDWEGVRLPHRRVYVDESMRPTTVLEIVRLERQRVTERDFRLL